MLYNDAGTILVKGKNAEYSKWLFTEQLSMILSLVKVVEMLYEGIRRVHELITVKDSVFGCLAGLKTCL